MENARSAPLRLHAGITYGQAGEQPLRLAIVRPASAGGPLPAVIWVHGGGWREGSYTASGLEWWCCPLMAGAGFVAVTVQYRLSFEAVFPAQIHDVKGGIRWVRAHAAEYGIDPDRIGIWGHSAGGHLAALAGVTGDLPELEGTIGPAGVSSAVQAVVAGSPVTDFTAGGEGWTGSAYDAVIDLFGGVGREKRDLMRLASPICHAHFSAAPTLVVHGDADGVVPVSQADTLVAALRAADVPIEYERLPGADHVLFAGERRYGREHGLDRLAELAVPFFRRWLGPDRCER